MSEIKRITEQQLADALKGTRLAVRTDDGLVNGEIHVPDNVALHVFRTVSGTAPEAPITDAEVGTIGAIVAALNELDDGESAGQPHGIYWRVLSYLASRYGYVLATED